ncbi:hypothetical protein [Streptomyces sp. NPDC005385]|uniref:hypothetical protein n=1 Tax=Streptomyces sp. NPDC005385 TaxID=3157039 RepID=UPI0033AA323B
MDRYGRDARKHARPDVAAPVEPAVQQRWQPLVRKRRQCEAATTITVKARARLWERRRALRLRLACHRQRAERDADRNVVIGDGRAECAASMR